MQEETIENMLYLDSVDDWWKDDISKKKHAIQINYNLESTISISKQCIPDKYVISYKNLHKRNWNIYILVLVIV